MTPIPLNPNSKKISPLFNSVGLDEALIQNLRSNGHDVSSVSLKVVSGLYVFNIDGLIVRSSYGKNFSVKHHKRIISEITALFNFLKK